MGGGRCGRAGAYVTSHAEADLGHARVHVTTPRLPMGVRTVQERTTARTYASLIRVQVECLHMERFGVCHLQHKVYSDSVSCTNCHTSIFKHLILCTIKRNILYHGK